MFLSTQVFRLQGEKKTMSSQSCGLCLCNEKRKKKNDFGSKRCWAKKSLSAKAPIDQKYFRQKHNAAIVKKETSLLGRRPLWRRLSAREARASSFRFHCGSYHPENEFSREWTNPLLLLPLTSPLS